MTAVNYDFSEDFARGLDKEDPLKRFKDRFLFPKVNGKDTLYFCGNSLGLQPKNVAAYIQQELGNWAEKGVNGHFEGDDPWFYGRLRSKPALAAIVGASEQEVVAMNSLTANLHFLMVSFYRPTPTRFKIITEADAFPSDQYMLESQVRFHGFEPEEAIVEIHPRAGEHTLRTEDIVATINQHGDSLALVMMSGVQYYTGQFFDVAKITESGKSVGAKVGFDLAHAVGNVPLHLHDWKVDFAAWCSYKYLNSGPGNVGGIFVHESYSEDHSLARFSGWWGHDEKERFITDQGFRPMPGADSWQLSNNNILALAAHQAALDIFQEAGMEELRKKSELLTGYLEFLIGQISRGTGVLEIISPKNPQERGCQLSLLIHKGGKAVFDELSGQGVVGDWRNPNVIRLAPVPLYNNFAEIYHFAKLLERSIEKFI